MRFEAGPWSHAFLPQVSPVAAGRDGNLEPTADLAQAASADSKFLTGSREKSGFLAASRVCQNREYILYAISGMSRDQGQSQFCGFAFSNPKTLEAKAAALAREKAFGIDVSRRLTDLNKLRQNCLREWPF